MPNRYKIRQEIKRQRKYREKKLNEYADKLISAIFNVEEKSELLTQKNSTPSTNTNE